MILPLARKNYSVWKQKFKNISNITPEIKKLVSDMRETLDLTSGVGLAAPQIGQPLRLFIINFGKLREVFINPKIITYGKEKDQLEEGCLSVPGSRGVVKRSTGLEMEYEDLKGTRKRASLKGYYARIAQHEYDHLSSIFYVDRITDKKKIHTYKPIKIVFFGTPEFGAIILKSLYGQHLVGDYKLQLVVTGPDKPSGRGKEPALSIVKKTAASFGLPIAQPVSLNNPAFINSLKKLKPDFIVLAAYGKIIPKSILRIPSKAAINVHPSLLPKYRGASPISTAILNGDKLTGVTIINMNEKIDEGDILASVKLPISAKATTQSLAKKLAVAASRLIHHVLHLYSAGKIKPRPQEGGRPTYTRLLKKEGGFIDWQNPPENLNQMVRAYFPWPGVWTKFNGKILKLLPENKVQLEGKKPISLEEFKAGHADFTLNW